MTKGLDRALRGPGHWPWDQLYARALVADVPEELADLGRNVMRDAAQHDWGPELRALCGLNDEGRALLEAARADPDQAHSLWEELLDTDGLRGHWEPGSTAWLEHEPGKPCLRCTQTISQLRRLLRVE